MTPRRSALFVPAENARALAKARTLPADVVIIDLEDAVAADNKSAARAAACDALESGGWRCRERLVRVNGLDTPWGEDDLRALAQVAAADGVLLPKVEGAHETQRARALLGGDAPALWLMCETARGVLTLAATLAARPVAGVVVGVEDLARELRLPVSAAAGVHPGLASALGHVIVAARASACAALDGVYRDYRDEAGFVASCAAARELGFDGKSLIHPDQIAPANRIFAPTAQELDEARRVLRAWQEASAEGRGVASVDGRLVEALHAEQAGQLLELARIVDGDDV